MSTDLTVSYVTSLIPADMVQVGHRLVDDATMIVTATVTEALIETDERGVPMIRLVLATIDGRRMAYVLTPIAVVRIAAEP